MRPERFHRLRAVLQRRQPDLTVLMDGVNKAHNFSAILRSCDAVGVLEAHVVPPARGLKLHWTSSAGTKKWITVHRHDDVTTAIGALAARGFALVAAHPGKASTDYREMDYTGPTAIVLGAELDGVSEEALDLVDRRVSIPLSGMVHSLNVSVATALIMFEARRQREAKGMYASTRLDPETFEAVLFEWAYPTLARKRREEGRAFPRLGPDGQIDPDG